MFSGTLFFRCGDMIISHKYKCGGVVIYSGVDPKNRSEKEFFSKCCQALSLLQQVDQNRHEQFVKHIGRLIGTMSYTRFWSFPRTLEVNYSEVFQGDCLSLAGTIVYETVGVVLGRKPYGYKNLETLYQSCLEEEVLFREQATGEKMSRLEIQKLKRTECKTPDGQRSALKQALKDVKKTGRPEN